MIAKKVNTILSSPCPNLKVDVMVIPGKKKILAHPKTCVSS